MLYRKKAKVYTYHCCNGPLEGSSGKIKLLPDARVIRFPHFGKDIWSNVGFVYYGIGDTVEGHTRLYHIETIPLLYGQKN